MPRREFAARCPGHRTVEHHDAPRTDIEVPAEHERRPGECRAHVVDEIVIARDAMHRTLERREQLAEADVAAGVVLHEIAGDQVGVGHGMSRPRMSECARQRRLRRNATQRRGRIAVQVRIGELDEVRGHCAGW